MDTRGSASRHLILHSVNTAGPGASSFEGGCRVGGITDK